MVKLNVITNRYAELSMDDPNLERNATALLRDRKCHFELEFMNLNENEFMNGHVDGHLRLKITEAGKSDPFLDYIVTHYESIKPTVTHLRNNRYISLINKDSHFVTIWSTRLNNYCEFFIYDYQQRTCKRFIP